MEPDCYKFTLANNTEENDLRIATPLALICLKIRAFLNLTEEKKTNPDVRSRDIKKHRDDVFKLLAAKIDQSTTIALPETLKRSIGTFAETIESSLPNQSLQDALDVDEEQIRIFIATMRKIFEVS